MSHVPNIVMIDVKCIALDPQNPRLPEELQGASQASIWQHLAETAVLDELQESMLENGFFDHEPLIVVEEKVDGSMYVAVEGNRRLASIMGLLEFDYTSDYPHGFEPRPEQLTALKRVPVYVVDDRDSVSKYLGFRHIGGLKPWSSEAKARYLTNEVDQAASRGEPNPFRYVGRRVGSNSRGVKTFYVALSLLRHARDQTSVNIGPVLKERFGSWLRAMNSKGILEYISVEGITDYSSARKIISDCNLTHLQEVIEDFSGAPGRPPLVQDSRQITQYGNVLINDLANQTLRTYGDLEAAISIIESDNFPDRIRKVAIRVKALSEEAQDTPSRITHEAVEQGADLLRHAKVLKVTLETFID